MTTSIPNIADNQQFDNNTWPVKLKSCTLIMLTYAVIIFMLAYIVIISFTSSEEIMCAILTFIYYLCS